MLVGVLHFFFKKGKTADGVVVILFLILANLLNKRLLDAWEQQASNVVDNQTRGSNKHQEPKRVQQSKHNTVETQR